MKGGIVQIPGKAVSIPFDAEYMVVIGKSTRFQGKSPWWRIVVRATRVSSPVDGSFYPVVADTAF